MGGSCPEGQYRDFVVKTCTQCQVACQLPRVVTRCITYCASARCKASPGHYYDSLLKKCMKCAEICGRHPPQCSQHCLTTSVTTLPSSSTEPSPLTILEDPTIMLYSLLVLCMVLLFSSLSLALAVFLRRSRAKISPLTTKTMKHKQERVAMSGEEVGLPYNQLVQTSKDYLTTSGRPTEREVLDESIPTETCVCVHCFPDLKCNDNPLKVSSTVYQPAALPQAIQKGEPLCNDDSRQTSAFRGIRGTEMTPICSLSN